jgi:acetyltransferase-like isoleucine patch superfamily enzyme
MFKYFGVESKIKPPYRILNPQRITLGDKTSIQEYSHINAFSDLSFLLDYVDKKYRKDLKASDYLYDSKILIDRECQIGRFFFLSCTHRVRIHPNVLISERVFIGDNNHTFSHPQVPVMQQPNQKGKPVEIKRGSWIGVGAAVLKGTSLGVNSVVGANSVVQGTFPARALIGAPRARQLSSRKG